MQTKYAVKYSLASRMLITTYKVARTKSTYFENQRACHTTETSPIKKDIKTISDEQIWQHDERGENTKYQKKTKNKKIPLSNSILQEKDIHSASFSKRNYGSWKINIANNKCLTQ